LKKQVVMQGIRTSAPQEGMEAIIHPGRPTTDSGLLMIVLTVLLALRSSHDPLCIQTAFLQKLNIEMHSCENDRF